MSFYNNSNNSNNPNLIWPLTRTQYDIDMQKKWSPFCSNFPIPTIREGFEYNYMTGNTNNSWDKGNLKLSLNDPDNPLSYNRNTQM